MKDEKTGNLLLSYDVIDKRDSALRKVFLRLDGRLFKNIYEGVGFEPMEVALYYDQATLLATHSAKTRTEIGQRLSTANEQPYRILVPYWEADKLGTIFVFELEVDPTMHEKWSETHQDNVLAESLKAREYFNGILERTYNNKYYVITREKIGATWSTGASDRVWRNSLIMQLANDPYKPVVVTKDSSFIKRVDQVRQAVQADYKKEIEKSNQNTITAIWMTLAALLTGFLAWVGKRMYRAFRGSYRIRNTNNASDTNAPEQGTQAQMRAAFTTARTEADINAAIDQFIPAAKGNIGHGLKYVIAMAVRYYGVDATRKFIQNAFDHIYGQFGNNLPQHLTLASIADMVFRYIVDAVYRPKLEEYARKLGFNLAEKKVYRIGGREINAEKDPQHNSLRGVANPRFMKYVIDEMIETFSRRIADGRAATARIWGYHEDRNVQNSVWNDGWWMKVERARIQATVKEAQYGNLVEELMEVNYALEARTISENERAKLTQRKEELEQKIRQARTGDENPYLGWFEVPLEEAFLREMFQFLAGGLQDQVAWTRHLLKVSADLYRQSRFDEVVPEVLNHTAVTEYLLADQYDKLNGKLRKGQKNWIWRSYFEEVFLSRLLQTKDYDELFQAYGVNGKLIREITNNGQLLNMVTKPEVQKLVQSLQDTIRILGDTEFPGYDFLFNLFEVTLRNAPVAHMHIIQELVDRVFLPVALKSLKVADFIHFTAPTRLVAPKRMLIAIRHFSPVVLTAGLIGAVAAAVTAGITTGFSALMLWTPAGFILGALTGLKFYQMFKDNKEEDGFLKKMNQWTKGPRGFYDTQLEILQKAAKEIGRASCRERV